MNYSLIDCDLITGWGVNMGVSQMHAISRLEQIHTVLVSLLVLLPKPETQRNLYGVLSNEPLLINKS